VLPADVFNPLKLDLRIQPIPQIKQLVTITTISWLILLKEIIAVYAENHSRPVTKNAKLLIVEAGECS
jgi:hypothetical protein